ncbi:MAG: RNA polymerase sigma factor [Solirubrobacteraceae bacterium]
MSPRFSDVFLRTQTDERLATLAEHGHERAFGVLVERYRPQLIRAAGRLVGSNRAEDVAQQTLLGAWSAIQNGTTVSHVSGWLHQILRNAVYTEHARSRLHGQLPDDLADLRSCDGEVESRMALAAILAEMDRLPVHQRSALVQTEFAGRSRRDVAAALGVSEGAVRQLVHRARNTLRLAATAITPFPLAAWAARPHLGSPLAHRVAELGGKTAAGACGTRAGAGGALLGGGALFKTGAAVLAAGALGGGLVIKTLVPSPVHRRSVPGVLSPGHVRGALTSSARDAAQPAARTSGTAARVGGDFTAARMSASASPSSVARIGYRGPGSTTSSEGRRGSAGGGDRASSLSSESSSASVDYQPTARLSTAPADRQTTAVSDQPVSSPSTDQISSQSSTSGSPSADTAASTYRSSSPGGSGSGDLTSPG